MTKNITIRMDEQLLKEVKHIAVERDMSVSAWITELIEKETQRKVRYAESKAFAQKAMEEAKDYGAATHNRDELHER